MRLYKNTIRKLRWPLLLFGGFLLLPGCASKHSAMAPPGEMETPHQQRAIVDMDVSEDEEMARVLVQANQPLTYTAVKHQFPLGVVLYFPDTALGDNVEETLTPAGSTIVSTIHTTALEKARPSSRIEIRLHKDAPYKVDRSGSQVLILFKKETGDSMKTQASVDTPASETKTQPAEENPATETSLGKQPAMPPSATVSEVTKAGTPPMVKEVSGDTAVVKRIDFEVLKKGHSRLTIETDKKAKWETVKSSDKRLLIRFYDTKIPVFQKRPLITTRFESAVDRVLPVQTEKMGSTAVLAVELRESVPYRVYTQGPDENVFVVDFEPSTVPPRPEPDARKSAWVQSMQETTTMVSAEKTKKTVDPVLTEEGKAYVGEKISLDFQDADIHNIFRILHEVSGENFVIGADVKGRVTLKLVNVPWDQVLDLILHMNQLGTLREGNVIRIATLGTLKSEQEALAQKRKAEEAAKELAPMLTKYIKLNYAKAADIKGHLVPIKTTRGNVTIDDSTNMIILNDEQQTIDKAMELIRELDAANQEIATRQVMIEARIVEADSSFTRDIGVQWGGDVGRGTLGSSSGNSNLLFGGNNYSSRTATASSPNFAVDLPPSSFSSALGFAFGRIAGTTINLDIRLQALEQQGRGRTISAPKVLTLDNQEATIKQVTKIPFQIIEDGTVSIKQEEAGIELSVTPYITRDERIRMKIHAEKGAPDWSNTVGGNPAIDTNTADTELFINDGQTIVIGGILTTEDTTSEGKTPWLNEIPVLGWLFKQKRTVRNKDELLIFITPRIIRLDETEQSGG